MIRLSFVHKARWLVTVDTFRQIAMEERTLDVELVNWPSARHIEVKHCANGRWLDNRRESLMNIKPRPLREASHNPLCLASF